MKEQDAAHSFEELIELKEELERTRLLLQNCNGDIIRADRELTRLRSELQQLKAWKESELKLWGPILEYMRTHPDRRLGESIPDRVLEFLKEHSRLKSELQQKDEAVLELSEILVIAYDALSVVRTEPTMSGSVLASFDKNKFIKIRGDFFEFLDKHKTLESLIKKAKLNN